ncbi:TPA: hypothetical protein MIM83_25660 [Klebsiella pneumoniae]|nr:hypothetical protein [Klebsiella pneumoniae]
MRLLTGCSRINSDVARRIPGIHRDPKDRLSSLKQVEEALDMLISSHGEYCPLPLTMDVQAENFPEGHCCKVSDEAAFCLIQRPYISKTLLTRRISPRGSP